MSFDRGDVLYGDDPFKGEEYARPWLVVSDETHPYHGEQYIILALTTRTWHDDLVEIPEAAWLKGGTPERSRVVPWSVETLEHDDIQHWQGSLESEVGDTAVAELVDYVDAEGR